MAPYDAGKHVPSPRRDSVPGVNLRTGVAGGLRVEKIQIDSHPFNVQRVDGKPAELRKVSW